MVKHKKTKRVPNNKKQKKKQTKNDNGTQKIPSIEEMIKAGDTAMAAMEPVKALTFFTSAQDLLEKKSKEELANGDAVGVQTTTTEKLVYVLEKLGDLKAANGNTAAAKEEFQNAIKLMLASPDKNVQKDAQFQETLAGLHLYIGQLSCEGEALEAYKKGLHCLEVCLELRQQQECEEQKKNSTTIDEETATATEEDGSMEVDTNNNQQKEPNTTNKETSSSSLMEVRQKLASARATVAELYLTDLCYEDNAETECESYVTLALQIIDEVDGEPMVDALQTAASLKLSQQRADEARAFILRAYQKIKVGCEALSQLLGGLASDQKSKRAVELVEVDAAEGLPSFDFRCQTAKLLLECASSSKDSDDDNDDKNLSRSSKVEQDEKAKCNAASIQVLGSLLAENDEVPDIWYLLGCAYHGEGNDELAQFYWSKAMEMLSEMQKELEKEADETDMQVEEDDDDDELDMQIQSISCQIEDIKSKLEDLEKDSASKMEM